ncbi:MAG: exosortase-associated EpsI family protein, partial [Phycisphaerales bacterium]
MYLKKVPVYPRKDFSVLPSTFGDWKRIGEDARFDASGVEALGTDLYLTRAYVKDGATDLPIQLHLAYYTGQVDAVPHVPDRCMVAGGYVPLTAEPVTLPMAIDTSAWGEDEAEKLDGVPYPVVEHWDTLRETMEIIRLPLGDFELRSTEF